jgi:para-nitrobenzyl esterase
MDVRALEVEEPVVATRLGAVRGARWGDVSVFRGIPYAAPPVGDRRFLPPAVASPWTGTLDATAVPAACPQPRMPRMFGSLDPGEDRFAERYDEDCLTLSVWTPAADGGRRPVMVWFHGGWFAIGSGNEPAYDGANLARRHDVVVVTVNHRLGALGHLAVEGVDGTGNAGVLDLVAALGWVRDEIAAFGGDPGCVTIFGESGGACKVSAVLAMPAAAGLFHRAILQSGPMLRAVDSASAAAASDRLSAVVGGANFHELQALPVDELLAAQIEVVGGPMGGMYGDGPRFAPVVDGTTLPQHPFDPDAAPTAAGVPLLIGSCRDEATVLLPAVPGLADLAPEAQIELLANEVFGTEHLELLPAYERTRPTASPLERYLAVVADQLRVGGIHIAERQLDGSDSPVYLYRLDYGTPVLGGVLGATHAFDVGFVFANTDAAASVSALHRGFYPDDDDVARLVEQMSGAWAAFARTGDPAHPALPQWPVYDTTRRATLMFDVETRVVDDPDGAERAAWSGRLGGM